MMNPGTRQLLNIMHSNLLLVYAYINSDTEISHMHMRIEFIQKNIEALKIFKTKIDNVQLVKL